MAERGNKLSSIVAEGREGAPICAEMGAPSARKDGPAMNKADRAAMGAPSSAAIRLPAGVSMVKYVCIGHVQDHSMITPLARGLANADSVLQTRAMAGGGLAS